VRSLAFPSLGYTGAGIREIDVWRTRAGRTSSVAKVRKGYKIGSKAFKVHLDGYNLLPFLSGKEKKSPREGFIDWSDDGDCMAVRMGR
jgi:arylsulfatase